MWFSEHDWAKAAAVFPADATTKARKLAAGIRDNTPQTSSSLKVAVSSVAPRAGQ
jgi:hypothetical protein